MKIVVDHFSSDIQYCFFQQQIAYEIPSINRNQFSVPSSPFYLLPPLKKNLLIYIKMFRNETKKGEKIYYYFIYKHLVYLGKNFVLSCWRLSLWHWRKLTDSSFFFFLFYILIRLFSVKDKTFRWSVTGVIKLQLYLLLSFKLKVYNFNPYAKKKKTKKNFFCLKI